MNIWLVSANARTYFRRPLRGESKDKQPAVLQKAESKALSQGKRTPDGELAGRWTIVLRHLPDEWWQTQGKSEQA
jgi:hypothetical protein